MRRAIQTLKASLDRQGCRLTIPRLKVLQAILARRDRFSADEIHRDVPLVGRATVFRTIKLLVDMDLLCKVTLENGAPRYRLGSSSHHYHFICVTCGRVDDFVPHDVDDAVVRLSYATGRQIVGHRIEVFEVCLDCQSSRGPLREQS